MEWYYWLALVLIAGGGIDFYIGKLRRDRLMNKYNNQEIVDKIVLRKFWMDQTEEQLFDSLGKPLDIDKKVLKSKTKEIWKYDEKAKNRYALQITLENGLVVGWDQK